MAKQKIKMNNEVLVIAGKFKGTTGRVLKVDLKNNKVTVDKVNIVKKHVKPSQTNPNGGIEEFEAPIHISNVKLHNKAAKKAEKAKDKIEKKETKTTSKDGDSSVAKDSVNKTDASEKPVTKTTEKKADTEVKKVTKESTEQKVVEKPTVKKEEAK